MDMGQQFCTTCGAKLSEGTAFCEHCGAKIEQVQSPAGTPSPGVTVTPSPPIPVSKGAGRFPTRIAIGILVVFIIAAAAVVLVVPKLTGGGALPVLPGQATSVPTTIPTPQPTPTSSTTTTVPTPPPDPFPGAYQLREIFSFNEGKYASRATVYRSWMNETYHWHNDMDNRYWTEPTRPNPGYKYLFVFVNIENIGKDGYPYPKSNMIVVHNSGNIYHVDTSHYLPDKAGNAKATPIEVQEVEYLQDYFNQEHVEDYGFSHGTSQDFVYPGQGNAVDGYLIFKVPSTLKIEETYVEIVFDGQDRAVWKLA